MQYYSNATSPDLPDPSLAFFFECEDCPGADKTPESIGTLSLIDTNAILGYLQISDKASNDPVWNEFGGPDDDGYFTFSKVNSFLQGMWNEEAGDNSYNNIGTVPDTDSMWVRIPSPAMEYMPLLFMGDKDGKDLYEISIGDEGVSADVGKIVFRFEEEGGSKTKCITDSGGPTGDGRYDNNKWQLITVIRTGDPTTHDTDCEIWVNNTDTGAALRNDGADSNLDKVKETGIGNNEKGKDGMESSTQQLNADVAMWMHWNEDELTASQIEDLYYKNYGDKSFTDINAGLPSVYYSASALGDYNNDGYLDIFLTTLDGSAYRLYKNKSDGSFEEDKASSGGFEVLKSTKGYDATFMDFDNDGLKDIFISNGIYGATNDMDYINFISNENIQKRLSKGMSEEDMEMVNEIPQKKVAN